MRHAAEPDGCTVLPSLWCLQGCLCDFWRLGDDCCDISVMHLVPGRKMRMAAAVVLKRGKQKRSRYIDDMAAEDADAGEEDDDDAEASFDFRTIVMAEIGRIFLCRSPNPTYDRGGRRRCGGGRGG